MPAPLDTRFLPALAFALRPDPLAELEGLDHRGRAHLEHYSGAFGAAVAGIGPPPCDLGCPWLERCWDQRLACIGFPQYVRTGKAIRSLDDRPTRRRYEALFTE